MRGGRLDFAHSSAVAEGTRARRPSVTVTGRWADGVKNVIPLVVYPPIFPLGLRAMRAGMSMPRAAHSVSTLPAHGEGGVCLGWVFFLISSGGQAPHVRPVGVHRTCGEPDEIELTPMGVRLGRTRGEPDEIELTPMGLKLNTRMHAAYHAGDIERLGTRTGGGEEVLGVRDGHKRV